MFAIKKFSTAIVMILAVLILLKRPNWVRDSFYALLGLVIFLKQQLKELLEQAEKSMTGS